MKALITSTLKGNNEINTINYSNSMDYLKEQGERATDAYIVENNKVILVLHDCEWVNPTKEEKEALVTDFTDSTNEIHTMKNEVSITITSYEDDETFSNYFLMISKDLTIKDLKRAIKKEFKVNLCDIDLIDCDDDEFIRDCDGVEGSFDTYEVFI